MLATGRANWRVPVVLTVSLESYVWSVTAGDTPLLSPKLEARRGVGESSSVASGQNEAPAAVGLVGVGGTFSHPGPRLSRFGRLVQGAQRLVACLTLSRTVRFLDGRASGGSETLLLRLVVWGSAGGTVLCCRWCSRLRRTNVKNTNTRNTKPPNTEPRMTGSLLWETPLITNMQKVSYATRLGDMSLT